MRVFLCVVRLLPIAILKREESTFFFFVVPQMSQTEPLKKKKKETLPILLATNPDFEMRATRTGDLLISLTVINLVHCIYYTII